MGPFFVWLVSGAIGPAAVGLPVNWAAEKLTDAATRWFKRLRHTDDLSRLVKAAAGPAAGLTKDEFDRVRTLLEQQETWDALGHGTVDQLAEMIAGCLTARAGRDSLTVAGTIARGLLEFAVRGLEPEVFQDVMKTRLDRMGKAQEDRAQAVDEALLGLHADLLAGFADVLAKLDLVLARLAPGPAGRIELLVYLSTLIDGLGSDAWVHQWYDGSALTEATIERKLYLTCGDERDLDADLLAGQCERLVVRGDPGSGKTWLAKRTARRCAEKALDALSTGGMSPDQVEIPLYTTCSDLYQAGSGFREAAVTSALDRLSDSCAPIRAALHGFFTGRHAPTLLVIDSLDEASGSDEILGRAPQPPWRIMLTTRASSWRDQLGLEPGNPRHRVGDIQPLRYPADIGPFIEQWFSGQPGPGEDLAAQIASRPDLQSAATVPLILTFFCILGGGKPLPEFRSDLYRRLLSRLLDGYWHHLDHPKDQQPLDKDACLRTLGDWAWSDARDRTDPVSGIGTWADGITAKPVWLSPLAAGALDHIAPPLGRADDDTGLIPRRFIHRSVREYLVAEHVSRLPVEQAAEALLPHLWYDPDWEDVAPAALALHAQRDQLLRDLIQRASGTGQAARDLPALDAGGEFRRFLARAACESREADWSPEAAAMIGGARLDLVRAGQVRDLGFAVHWETSNRQAREELLALMAGQAGARTAAELAGTMIHLNPTAADARQACAMLTGLLASTTTWLPGALVGAVVRLATAADDEEHAREALLGIMTSQPDPLLAAELTLGIARLKPSGDDKHQVREVLLTLMTSQNRDRLGLLARAVAQLGPAPDDKQRARAAVLGQLTTQRNGRQAADLAGALTSLDPAPEQRRQAREALLGWLARDSPAALGTPAWGTPQRTTSFLAQGTVAAELDALTGLAATEEDKAPAREAFLSLLSRQPGARLAEQLAAGLAWLDPTDADRTRARETLLALLTQETNGQAVAQFWDGISHLAPAPEDKLRARKHMLGLLAGQAAGATRLVGRLAGLDPASEETKRARALLLERSRADSFTAEALLVWLPRLDPAPEDKLQARGILLGFLAHEADRELAASLALLTAQFDPGPQDQRSARGALLDLLAHATDARATGDLASAIAALNPTSEDKLQAREILRGLLANGQAATEILSGMTRLDPPVSDLGGWREWAARPTVELLAAARRNSALREWLAALPDLPDDPLAA